MISVGERDRLIEVAAQESQDDDAGAPNYEAAAWTSYFAKKVDVSLESVHTQQMRQPAGRVAFIIEYVEDLELPLFLRYEGDIFDVITLEELGYKEAIKLGCRMIRRNKPL